MTAKLFYKLVLITLTSLVVYYILATGINLIFKLAVPSKPECNPIFCKEIINENKSCLLKIPGPERCLDIEGYFLVFPGTLAYSLLALSLGLSYYFSIRFYLTRIFFVVFSLALILLAIKIILGTVQLSPKGVLVEFNNLGLNQPFIQEFGGTIFQMIYPKL